MLTHRLPIAVAGWPQSWRYAWPRDTSHVAVALHSLGDSPGVLRQLVALNHRVGRAPVIEARYQPQGGKPDNRPAQDDGWGWVLWALSATEDSWRDTPFAGSLVDLAYHCADQLLNRVGPDSLPRPSPDYWEVEAPELTLGTAAPSLMGLERAAILLSDQEHSQTRELASQCS